MAEMLLSEDEISSAKSLPITLVTSRKKGNFKKPGKISNKTASTPSSRATAKLNDLSKLEEKLSGQIQERFSSLDGKWSSFWPVYERIFF